MRSLARLFCALFAVLCLSLLFYSSPGRAATTFTVNSVADTGDATPDGACNDGSGNCTLREAIQEANTLAGADTIAFDLAGAGPHTIQLASALPDLNDSVDILNTSGESVTVRRNAGGFRIFNVNSGQTVNISGLTISNGSASNGSGIFNNGGTLTLTNSAVSGNSASGVGGGIANNGTLTITNSTVSGNSIILSGNGGGIYNSGTVTLTNSTVSGNSTGGSGGGIFNSGGTLTLTSVTVTDNRADSDNNGTGTGGGIFINSGTPLLRSTIVAGNFNEDGATDSADDIKNGTADPTSSYNLIGTGGSGGLTNGSNNNQVGVANPGLGALANNGGPTQTHRLLSNSPAIDKGDDFSATATTDQRGALRPFDDPAITNAGDGSDIGAFEVQGTAVQTAPSFVVNTPDDHDDGACTVGDCTLREAVNAANATAGTDTITFDIFGAGPHTIQLGSSLNSLSDDVNISNTSGESITVRGEGASDAYHIFVVASGDTVSISGLTISNGSGNIPGGVTNTGGGIYNTSTLTLTDCVITGNNAQLGGGIYNSGTLVLTNSTVRDNTADARGGGIYIGLGGTIEITNSTVSGNSGGDGGGIFNNGDTLTLTNSTVSGNSTAGAGGGILTNGDATLTGVTVTDNRADSDNNGTGTGGGIYISSGTPLLRNTIVAGNFNENGASDAADDISNGTADPASSYNLIGTGGSGGLANGTNNNQVGVANPGLGALANNGGPTQTHALLPLSPAIDKGADCVTDNSCSPPLAAALTTDQRGAGFPRKVGTHVDIGAYEVNVAVQSGSPSFVVNKTADTNDGFCAADDCTLREAITAANAAAGADTITFDPTVFNAPGPHTIQLTAALPDLSSDININGPGANVLSVRGEGAADPYTIFFINSGQTVNISGLTVSNGAANGAASPANQGGGIHNRGTLTLTNCTVSGNSGKIGAGVFNFGGTLNLTNSTVSGNSASSNGGGIVNAGTLNLTNSTVSNNTATSQGGGIFSPGGTFNLTNSTVSGNSASDTGGIYVGGGVSGSGTLTGVTVTDNRAGNHGGIQIFSGTLLLRSTIVADNYLGAGTSNENNIDGTADAASSYNLIGTGGSGGLTDGSNNNQVGVADPGLAPLANNGGPTQTHALAVNSPALDKGKNFGASTDQRGETRPVNFAEVPNAAGGDGSDIGAYELQTDDPPFAGRAALVVNTTGDAPDTNTADGLCDTDAGASGEQCTLRAAIQEANVRLGPDIVNFDTNVFTSPGPHVIQLTTALPDLSSDITINGPGVKLLTVARDGAAATRFRIFTVTSGVTVNISGLTATGGFTADALGGGVEGGGILNDGTLTLSGVSVSGNQTGKGGDGIGGGSGGLGGFGGGIFVGGTATIVNSTISGNQTGLGGNGGATGGGFGGGIAIGGVSTLTLVNSTVSGNQTSAGGDGGGINVGGTLNVSNSTITANTASNGGGIRRNGGTITLSGTIVAGNSASGSGPDIDGDVQSDGYNLIQNTSAATINQNPGAGPDITGVDPQLSPLADNGGPTDTHALAPTSPAIDQGKNFPPPSASPSPTPAPTPIPTDQRGFKRPVDFADVANAAGGDGSDIGAYERQANTPPALAGQLVISEFRLRGPDPNGAENEFIELYNNTNSPHTVSAGDGSAGYGVAASDGLLRCTIPSGTVIPARGHFLCVNSVGYSLSNYPSGNGPVSLDTIETPVIRVPKGRRKDTSTAAPADVQTGGEDAAPPSVPITATGDATYTTDIPDNAGIALFSSTATFTLANRLDAVGSTSEANTLYKEGTGYPALGGLYSTGIDYSLLRDLCGKGGLTTILGPCPQGGFPKDTDNNAADFIFVDTNGTSAGAGQRLGAPGPENLSSPVQRNSNFPGPNIDSTVGSTSAPNRIRDFTSDPANNSTFGTLDLRKRIINNTGGPITRLRFRIMDFSTFPAPSGYADLRVRTSTLVVVSNINDAATCLASNGVATTPCTVNVQGTTLEQPPSQLNGGGYNSTLSAGTVTLGTPLADGASINLHFLLGIQQTGTFKFFINVEALP